MQNVTSDRRGALSQDAVLRWARNGLVVGFLIGVAAAVVAVVS